MDEDFQDNLFSWKHTLLL